MLKASGFNPLKVRPFQGCGFKRQPAPLQHGGREPGDVDASVWAYAVDRVGELIKVRRCEVEHIRFTPRVEHRVLNTAC